MAESEPMHNHVEKNTSEINKIEMNKPDAKAETNGGESDNIGSDRIESNTLKSHPIESNTGEADTIDADREERIYAKFLSGIDPITLQATSPLGDDTFKEICSNLGATDPIASEFIKSELERLRLKLIFMQRLCTFGIAPDCRKGLLDAIKDFKSLELVALYRRTDTCAQMIEIIERVASEVDIDLPIITRAKTILLTHLSFFLTLLPPTAAATAISIAVLTFHAKCIYSIIRIAKASHIAESTVYESIKRLIEFKGFPKMEAKKFYTIESLVFSFKGFFVANKRVLPNFVDRYKGVQNRFRARILLSARSGVMNSIRFQRKYLPLKEYFETNLVHLINTGFISFKYNEIATRATYKLTYKGHAELNRSLEFYGKVDEVSKLGESAAAEDWALWAGIESNEVFGITLPLGFLVNPKENGEA